MYFSSISDVMLCVYLRCFCLPLTFVFGGSSMVRAAAVGFFSLK